MNTSKRQNANKFHDGFHSSSHYFRSSQPDTDKASTSVNANKPSKEKLIDVFEFEPVGFMSHGRW